MKSIIILSVIISFLYASTQSKINVSYRFWGGKTDRSISRIPTPTPEHSEQAIILDNQKPIAQKIRAYFKKDADRAIAIFRAESGLNAHAQGWNCTYGPCKPEDREKAKSTDCGIAQINFPGKVCPARAFNEDWNIQKAYMMYTRRGFQPWTVFNSGSYKKFIKTL